MHFAVEVALSRLPLIRDRRHLRRFAERLVAGTGERFATTVFGLPAGDVVLLCDGESRSGLHRALERDLAALSLPVAGNALEHGDATMTWFDLSQPAEKADLLRKTDAWAAIADTGAPKRPLQAQDLGPLAAVLQQSALADLIRSQPALVFGPAGTVKTLFREVFFAIDAVEQRIAAGIDLRASPALFRALTRSLDRCLLRTLTADAIGDTAISVNLHPASLDTPEFADLQTIARNGPGLVVEIHIVDVLDDVDRFWALRRQLAAAGIRVLLDGLTPSDLTFVDVHALAPDYTKILWRPATTAVPVEPIRAAIARLGADRLILARAESTEAVEWAAALGIARLQGHFVDRVAARLGARAAG
jgi:hypothetical protein